MARGQIIRLTQRAVEADEAAVDADARAIAYFETAAKDNVINIEEIRELRRLLVASEQAGKDAYAIGQAADQAFGIGISILRGGIHSGYAREQGFDPGAYCTDQEHAA